MCRMNENSIIKVGEGKLPLELSAEASRILMEKALTEVVVETVMEKIPILGFVFKTCKKTEDVLKEACLVSVISVMWKDISRLKEKFSYEWFGTPEGKNYCTKIVSIATNGEHIEKIEAFAHTLSNSASTFKGVPIDRKMQFAEILKVLTMLDLIVLAEIKKWAELDAVRKGYKKVEVGYVLPHLGDKYSMNAVEASFINLVNNGVLSKISHWTRANTERGDTYLTGLKMGDYDIAYYTSFTMEFIKFISKPEGEKE